MKKDPKALTKVNRYDGNQTVKVEAVRDEASSEHKAHVKTKVLQREKPQRSHFLYGESPESRVCICKL